MQSPNDHAIQNHVCWQGGIFASEALELLPSLTGQQMKRGCRPPRLPRVARLAFLKPNFTNLTSFRDIWRQKNRLAFSLQYLAILEQLAHAIRFGIFNILLKSVIRNF